MKKLVILTGAGISAESGIKTFRDSDGLWENHRVEDVATYEAWENNPTLVLDFYNQRRSQLKSVEPNSAHKILVELEQFFNVEIITQNVDNLHERAGSSKVMHLHGELTKAKSVKNDNLVIDIKYNSIKIGDKGVDGEQLRPYIVWFGEAVPLIEDACRVVAKAYYVAVIGTSMLVYPAASLIHYASSKAECFYIDPNAKAISGIKNLTIIDQNASIGVEMFKNILLKKNF